MTKSEVYSWRVSPQMKRLLEDAARQEKQSISAVLEKIVNEAFRNGMRRRDEGEAAVQERLHTAAMATIGTLKSKRSDRSERVRELVRRKLRQRHGRARTH
jgi:hypothetical protein